MKTKLKVFDFIYKAPFDNGLTEFAISFKYCFTNFSAKIYSNPPKALEEIQSIANKQDTILVFGSFFLLSDFF